MPKKAGLKFVCKFILKDSNSLLVLTFWLLKNQ